MPANKITAEHAAALVATVHACTGPFSFVQGDEVLANLGVEVRGRWALERGANRVVQGRLSELARDAYLLALQSLVVRQAAP